jgi:hypothetical protein
MKAPQTKRIWQVATVATVLVVALLWASDAPVTAEVVADAGQVFHAIGDGVNGRVDSIEQIVDESLTHLRYVCVDQYLGEFR